jgi:Ca2+-binding EF-hand superfamily protein
MRVWCFVLAIVAIACPLRSTFAQGKDKKAGNLQAEVLKRVMARFDLDGDGNVSDEEKAKVVEEFTKDVDDGKIPEGFAALLDKNKNGKLDPVEAAAFQAIVGQLRAGAGGPPQFGAGNGAPGVPGFGGPGFGGGDAFGGQVPPEVLKKFDKNKDGQLDDKEKKAAMTALGPKKSRKEMLQEKLDLNGDGKITKEEREEVAAQRKAEAEEKKAAAAEKKAKAKAKREDDKDGDEKADDKAAETKDPIEEAEEEKTTSESTEGKRTKEYLLKAVERGHKNALADELDEADKKRLVAQVARLKKEIEKGNDPRLEVDDLSRLPGDDVRLIRAYFPEFMPE